MNKDEKQRSIEVIVLPKPLNRLKNYATHELSLNFLRKPKFYFSKSHDGRVLV